jgi:hypothetical protein
MVRPLASVEFNELTVHVKSLKTKFISREIAKENANPLSYSPDIEKIAAFNLLVHAAVEDYLETKARNYLNSIDIDIQAGRIVSSKLEFYLIAKLFQIDLPFHCPFDNNLFNVQASLIVKRGLKEIGENNGIKANSFYLLSLLSGKRMNDIDDTLSLVLNDYGKNRGQAAHKSTKRVMPFSGPRQEAVTAENILALIKKYFYPKV